MDSIGHLEAINSINIMDRENRKANFLKQEVKNHIKIDTDSCRLNQRIHINILFTLELQSLKPPILPIGFNILHQATPNSVSMFYY